MMGWAQVEARYDKGNVPVVNGRVHFQETIATSQDQATSFALVSEWAKQRFSKANPNVRASKFTSEDDTNCTLNLTAEEYIVFTKRFFVLDRTRINYWVEIQCHEGSATIKMTRINYCMRRSARADSSSPPRTSSPTKKHSARRVICSRNRASSARVP